MLCMRSGMTGPRRGEMMIIYFLILTVLLLSILFFLRRQHKLQKTIEEHLYLNDLFETDMGLEWRRKK